MKTKRNAQMTREELIERIAELETERCKLMQTITDLCKQRDMRKERIKELEALKAEKKDADTE